MALVKNITRFRGDTSDIRIYIEEKPGKPYDFEGTTVIRLGISTSLNPSDGSSPLGILEGVIDTENEGWVTFPVISPVEDIDLGEHYAQIRFIQSGKIASTDKFRYYQEAASFDI